MYLSISFNIYLNIKTFIYLFYTKHHGLPFQITIVLPCDTVIVPPQYCLEGAVQNDLGNLP